jgi:hypothetical protein
LLAFVLMAPGLWTAASSIRLDDVRLGPPWPWDHIDPITSEPVRPDGSEPYRGVRPQATVTP